MFDLLLPNLNMNDILYIIIIILVCIVIFLIYNNMTKTKPKNITILENYDNNNPLVHGGIDEDIRNDVEELHKMQDEYINSQ